MTHFYGDYSNHDWTRGGMDVAAMAADGIEGGFHKLSDGLNYYVDPYFQTAINRMNSSTFKFYGAYHVLWGNRDIASQVDWMISLLDSQCSWWRGDPKFRIMSDDEPFGYNVKPSIDQINQFHDIFLSKVSKLQFAYAPRWTYGSTVTGIRYPVIASNYGSNPNVHYPDGYPGDGSSRWVDSVLQYGSMLIQGTQNQTDCNAVKDDAIWAQLVGEDMALTFREKADIARLVLVGLSFTEGYATAQGTEYAEFDHIPVNKQLSTLTMTGVTQDQVDAAVAKVLTVDMLKQALEGLGFTGKLTA